MSEDSPSDEPSDPYQALLRAAFGHSTVALRGWRAWQQAVDLDHLPSGMFELMPVLYTNIQPLLTNDALLGRLKGIYRQSWLHNQRLWGVLEPTWRECSEVGVSLAFLGNLSLAWEKEQLSGIARVSPVALLAKPGETSYVISLLQGHGWRCDADLPAKHTTEWLMARQSQSFHHSSVGGLRLFWSLRWPGHDDEFLWWDAPLPRLSLTVEMLLACLLPHNPYHRAAAMLNLLRRGQPDWKRLLQWTDEWLLGCHMHHALELAQDVRAQCVPDVTRAAFRTLADRPDHRRIFCLQSRSSNAWSRLRWLWELYSRSPLCSSPPPQRLLGFCRFIKNRGSAGRYWRRLFCARAAQRNA
jgi:hypothetical protein